jgi:hypothetical protein
MPEVKNLPKSYWKASLKSYIALTEQPMSLKPWVEMKKDLLKHGIAAS